MRNQGRCCHHLKHRQHIVRGTEQGPRQIKKMIQFPKNTEQRVVNLGHGKETWSLNTDLSCPYCNNTKVWTRLLCSNQETKDKIVIYNNSPHFCAQCKTRFILYKYDSPDPEQEEKDNRTRSVFLEKDTQLNLGSVFNKKPIIG